MRETRMETLGAEEEDKCQAQRLLPRLSHSDIEITSTHDKSWVDPARREISNTLRPHNKYTPLREIQGYCQSIAGPT